MLHTGATHTEGTMHLLGFDTSAQKRTLLLLLMLAMLVTVQPVYAQEGEPTLAVSLRKDFGYALGSHIQGTFSVHVGEEEDITQIALWIDEEQITVDDEAPYSIRFTTSDFTPGVHNITVIGLMTDGDEISSQPIEVEFLTTEQARGQAFELLIPVLAIVLVVMVLGALVPALIGRRKLTFKPGAYGPAGGAICTRCNLPFSRNYFSPNLLVGKLERCPHCGKWSIAKRASTSNLEAAEARFAASMAKGGIQKEDEGTLLRRMIDDSRYENSD